MDHINVALVGCGFVANGHLRAWKKIKQAKVVAVCDLDSDLAKRTALKWKVPHHYSSYSELLNKEKLNVVDICTPPHTHVSLAVQAMESGINVVIEKPMAMTVSDARKIVACQRRTNVKVGVIHNWLFNAPVLEASSIIQKGLLGEVYSVGIETFNTKDDLMAANEHHWCHKFPGGRFSEMLAHPIYLTRHFLGGNIEIAAVQVSKIGGHRWMKTDELAVILNSGQKIGRIYASFNSPRDAVFINVYGKEGMVKMELINSILIFLPKRKLSRFSKGFDSLRQAGQIIKWTGINMLKVVTRRWMSGHDVYIKKFAESILSDCEPPVSAMEGLAVVDIVEKLCTKIAQLEDLSS